MPGSERDGYTQVVVRDKKNMKNMYVCICVYVEPINHHDLIYVFGIITLWRLKKEEWGKKKGKCKDKIYR